MLVAVWCFSTWAGCLTGWVLVLAPSCPQSSEFWHFPKQRAYIDMIHLSSISEISTANERGMLLSGYQTAIQLAALVGFWAAFAAHASLPDNSILQWQIPVAIQLVPGVLLLLGSLLIVESPRFLAEKGSVTRAGHALAWLRSLPWESSMISRELEELQTSTTAGDDLEAKNVSLLKALRSKSLRKRLMVGMGLMIAQNMVGLNALNYCKLYT